MNRKTGFNLAYVFVATAGVLALHALILRATQVPEITYDEFQKHLKDSKVRDVVIYDRHVSGTILNGEGKKQKFVAARVEGDLAKELGQYNVKFRRQIESTFLRDLLSWVLPVLLFFAVWFFIAQRFANSGLGGGFMTIGKSKAKVYVETDTKVRFGDVAGVDEAVAELREIVDFLKDPKAFGKDQHGFTINGFTG